MHIIVIILIMSFSVVYAQKITLGVVPQESPAQLTKVWKPIAKYLSDSTGEMIVFQTQKSIPLFEKSLHKGSYDFAYTNPHHFVTLNQKMHYSAEVRAKKDIVGVLVGRKSKDIQILLKEEPRFLFPAPNAFAATLLIKYELMNKFKYTFDDPKKIGYIRSHDSVYRGVIRGLADLGGGIERTLDVFLDEHKMDQLKIVYRTKPYPSHPFAFHPEMDIGVKEKIIKALLQMPEKLKAGLKVKEFIPTHTQEYKGIERMLPRLK